ncbi:MAG TPA: bestrophin family protein [Saprospiraceae bacterium]|nr:bestrophin family protein [Saprospiraceae bacterium]HMP13215.1 bestrophin family protein [Saprospiraceae bacterium]
MIYYKTNGNWFGDINHLFRSWTMTRIIRSVLFIGAYTAVICFVIDFYDMGKYLSMNISGFSLLGIILSIFLVFRTNSAYDRWWEARKHWGALVNNTRNLAVYVHAMFPKNNHEVRHFMAKHIANFCIALVEHLREGVHIEKLIYLHDEERAIYKTKGHIPNYIAFLIFDRIAEAHRQGEINEGDYINIKEQHQSLLDILGACERIKKTPIPFSYAVYLKVFISAYGLLLPFALVETFQYGTIPLVMFLFFSLLGIELMGQEIEDPFGLDCNDLPTGDIAHTIKTNVFEILEDKSGLNKSRSLDLYEKVF